MTPRSLSRPSFFGCALLGCALGSLAPAVAAQDAEQAAAADQKERQWTQLFNGRDLTGWTPKIRGYEAGDNFADTFRVVDGLLTVSYDGYEGKFDRRFGHLFFAAEYANYRLRCEYRFVGEQMEGGPGWAFRNSGLMLHGQPVKTMGKNQDFPASIEVQLLGGRVKGERPTINLCTPGTHVVRNGQLWTQHCLNSESPTFREDEWVTVEVEIRGDRIRHLVHGDTVLAYDEPQLDPRDGTAKKLLADGRDKLLHHGTISLQSESHPIQFRKVELLELDQPEPWLAPLAADLAKHFETKGNWTVVDGVAKLTPGDGQSGWRRFDHYLWLKGEYSEFEAEFEYRFEQKNGNSGFYWHVGDRIKQVATGVEVQLFDTAAGKERLTDHDSGGIIPGGPPTKNAAKPTGKWNHMHVLCEAGELRVTLNGKLVHTMALDHKRIANRPRSGAIGFQDHSLPIELRGFRIRRL